MNRPRAALRAPRRLLLARRLPAARPDVATAQAEGLPGERAYATASACAPPPAGTVPYRPLVEPALATGLAPDGTPLRDRARAAHRRAARATGRERFDVNCAVCHGVLGDGESQVALNMSLRRPPSLHDFRDVADGCIYQVITQRLRPHALLRHGAHGRGALGGGRVRPRPAALAGRVDGAGAARGAWRARGGGAMSGAVYQGGGRALRLGRRRRGRRARPHGGRRVLRPAPRAVRVPRRVRLLARHRARRAHPARVAPRLERALAGGAAPLRRDRAAERARCSPCSSSRSCSA